MAAAKKPPPSDHPIDWQQASRFHKLIHGTNETEYRFIKPGAPTIHKWGDLNDVTNPNHHALQALQNLNDDGYGAFMVINQPNPNIAIKIREGKGGTTDTDIINITALFVDIDKPERTPGENLTELEDAEVPPSLIIQSSAPHKVHGYWLVNDMTPQLWLRLQPQMIARFSADPTCKNLSRIMRIPGFWHTKGTPTQTRIIA